MEGDYIIRPSDDNESYIIQDNRFIVDTNMTKKVSNIRVSDKDAAQNIIQAFRDKDEEIAKEQDKYSQLFHKYWQMKCLLNQVKDVSDEYNKIK